MNTKLSALALLVITMTLPATATEQDKELRQLNKQAEQQQPAAKKGLRGPIYEVQPDLRMVEADTVQPTEVVASFGEQAIVRSVSPMLVKSTDIVPGTVVKNRMTGEFGHYSGVVSVLLNDASQLTELQKDFDLTLVQTAGDARLVLLQAKANTNLMKLKKALEASALVQEVQLDLVEKRQVAY